MKSVEAITTQLYESSMDGKLYPEVSDEQIARELFEAGEPIGETLRHALSPALMRFFTRIEQALVHDPVFKEEIERELMTPPSYLMPYSSSPEFLDDQERGEDLSLYQRICDHDAAVPGHHFTNSRRHRTYIQTRFNFKNKDTELSPELMGLYRDAHFAQHRDGYCISGWQAQQRMLDEEAKTSRLNIVEKPILEHCLTYDYPAYRVASTFSEFSLTKDIRMPLTDINDMDDIETADRTIRSTVLLLQLLAQDRLLSEEIAQTLQDENIAAHIKKYTQRGRDKINAKTIDFLQHAILKTTEEGIGSSILPAIAELRRPDKGERMTMEEIVARKKVTQLTTLSPLSYIGKVNMQGRGLPSVQEQDEQKRWRFTDEAKVCLRAMRTYMRRQFHYARLQSNLYVQTGGRCPFAMEDIGMSTDVISAATELVFLLSTHVSYPRPWSEYGDGMKYYLQQRAPSSERYTPGEAPDLSGLLERTERFTEARYRRLGYSMARAALSRQS